MEDDDVNRILGHYKNLAEEDSEKIGKLKMKLHQTEQNLLDLSDADNMDFPAGPSTALSQQNRLLREENKKIIVEKSKAVKELKSIKKKLLKLSE